MHRFLTAIIALFMLSSATFAQSLRVEQVAENIYAIVGPLGQRSPSNLGNNATFGLVVTANGAVLIDTGGSYLGAKALHEVIKDVTDQPVVKVINTGGQDHRWLGNGYWHQQGAEIIASQEAIADQADRASMQMTVLSELITTFMLDGTKPYFADVAFAGNHGFSLGGIDFELTHGAAHTPGDSTVWLPGASVMFTGDMVYVERILGIGTMSSSKEWVTSFEAMAAHQPAHIIPGHGAPTDLASAELDTYDYLVNLRDEIGALIEEGGDIIDAPKVDQSAFSYLANFEGLAGRNAQETYSQMEWE
ncbi:MAG: MBL fold metallo-hydrolase [Rhodobacteraceae bacterium]|nr:MBL fold metallo-hydrolase [Paracoccaceae bacterium]